MSSLLATKVKLGLVASLRSTGRQSDWSQFSAAELTAKRLQLLGELLPDAARVAVMVSPATVANTEATLRDIEAAGPTFGLQFQVFKADTSREIDASFESMRREPPNALFVAA